MLSYSVKQLLQDPSLRISVETILEPEVVKVGEDTYPCLEPWKVKGELVNVSGEAILFEGSVSTSIQMRCARCNEPVIVPIDVTIHQRFIKEGSENDVPEEDFDYLIIENDRVDLDDTILYEVQLGVPMRVFCKEDCKGLCPICGKNLNVDSCNCQEDDSDPRWDALKDLFSE